ncbi:MAG: DUF2318 domain-containing protein [Firmicutes bacterium HGW-Firmicutes-2]|jgi:uncharacterized membrane protein|uniref:Membrane iron-sulfur containing protein FtrD-like domain-containing protein n=1 Tax=Petrocella atlantisensis TaxID=2173034 RepID=A0A3P7PVJ4_9FIRM|nr:DUF2318 domain-containing protein [Petrocella atlantisensis]PKM65923.1 MAG: DUF2318 domain-containing protein [Firmicutes bacterium HGW-Firmicutes-2]VDN47221.1 conserved protein of unknown function [Petrocella atlantisensis]
MSKQTIKKSNKKNNMNKLIIIALSAVVLLAVAFSIKVPDSSSDNSSKKDDLRAEKVIDSDVVIPVIEITETARFYPAKINGIELEALAVKAPDGSIRTAFNTCQVCYSSGRGYYVQEGDVLVCQNCGNRFAMDDVEVTRGGCNPVPITEEYKTVSDDSITISKDFLAEATVIFQNWK